MLILLQQQEDNSFTEVLRQNSKRELDPKEQLKAGRRLADAFETLEEESND